MSEDSEDINLKELFYDIFEIVKFELEFYKNKESPMFEKIISSRNFQSKLKNLQEFIFKYFEKMYSNKNNPITKLALRSQLNNIAQVLNYYDDLSEFYKDQMDQIINKEKLMEIIEYSHIETLFLIFTNILDWEHQRKSIFFDQDESKGKLLKQFLSALSDSKIKSMADIIKLEEKINELYDTIEFFFDYYFQ